MTKAAKKQSPRTTKPTHQARNRTVQDPLPSILDALTARVKTLVPGAVLATYEGRGFSDKIPLLEQGIPVVVVEQSDFFRFPRALEQTNARRKLKGKPIIAVKRIVPGFLLLRLAPTLGSANPSAGNPV